MKNLATCKLNTSVLEALIENPYVAYVIVDEEGFIIYMNQTYMDILELKIEEVMGKHILEITPHSRLPETLRTGRIYKADIWPIKGRDTIVCRMPIIKNGEVIGAIGQSLFLDMAGARILMKKLQETEAAFSEGLVQSPYMVYVIVDKNGIITFMNQTYLDMLEMKREDVVGKHIHKITPHSRLPEILKTGEVHEVANWEINGRETIVTRAPIVKDGEIIGAVGRSLFLDISSAKMLVNKLQETENKLQETEKELKIYKEELRQIYGAKWQFEDLIGQTQEFLMVKSMAQQLSQTRSTLLITGESGTGKELFAQAIHNNSGRESGPFVRINCAALPENLLESELFGYEEGAFTGAKKGGKPGKFELAKKGTIFLDEIGDMPLTMQTKLLSVLQERIIERVGGNSPIPIDVRIIAATNRNLEEMVKKQTFREDLYYRLNVVRLDLPSLRERMADISLLVEDLAAKINNKLKTDVKTVSVQAMNLLQSYSWPGNVRELENLLERAVNLADMNGETCLDIQHFPSLLKQSSNQVPGESTEDNLNKAVEKLEKEVIQRVLKKTRNNKAQASRILGLNKSVLYRKLDKYNIK